MKYFFGFIAEARAIWYIPHSPQPENLDNFENFAAFLPSFEKLILLVVFLVMLKPLLWEQKDVRRRSQQSGIMLFIAIAMFLEILTRVLMTALNG